MTENRIVSQRMPPMMVAGLALLLIATLLLGIRATFHAAWSDTYVSAIVGALLFGMAAVVFSWSRRRWDGATARTALLRVLLITVSLVLSLVALEWIARFAFWDVHSSADARTYLALRALPVRQNSLGFRDKEVPPKSPDRYRIVIIGDSITWGQGVEEGERFSNLLQRDLGSGYEVINFGMRAHDMPEHLQELDQALPLSPDFVLLQLYINDFETRHMMRPVARPLLPWPDLDRRLLASSVLYGLLAAQWKSFQESRGWVESYQDYMKRYLGDPNSPASQLSFGMLREFFQRAAAARVPAGVVIFPDPWLLGKGYLFPYLHNHIREVCMQEHVDYVDLRPAFAKMGDVRGLWANRFDPHPNARAHQRAEEEILATFAPVWRRRATGAGDRLSRAGGVT